MCARSLITLIGQSCCRCDDNDDSTTHTLDISHSLTHFCCCCYCCCCCRCCAITAAYASLLLLFNCFNCCCHCCLTTVVLYCQDMTRWLRKHVPSMPPSKHLPLALSFLDNCDCGTMGRVARKVHNVTSHETPFHNTLFHDTHPFTTHPLITPLSQHTLS